MTSPLGLEFDAFNHWTMTPNILCLLFLQQQLQMITERLLRSFDTKVDAFLAEMDRSITASRDVFKNLEASTLRTITPEEWDGIQLKVRSNVILKPLFHHSSE